MKPFVLLLVAALSWLANATGVTAHALEPGYLNITPFGEDQHRVFWSKPDVQGAPMQIEAVLPEGCDPRRPPAPSFNGTAWIAGFVATCEGGLVGGTILIEGLDSQRTDVLARIEVKAGDLRTERLTPDRPGVTIAASAGWADILMTYLGLGVEHILGGIDHLLFVFALLLLITDGWRLLGAITAFTLAHSITLAAATLGYVSLPSAPVEAVIALSIMFLASELVQRKQGQPRLSERFPWLVSFSFGLLHGFGFAGALHEIGLPQGDVPLALLAFNLGVELGQLMFVAVVLAMVLVLRLILPGLMRALVAPGSRPAVAMAYGIGAVSAYWFIDRMAGFI